MALLSEVNGIGPKTLELFNKLNIYTTDDLVNHYPFRYDIIGKSNISSLNDGDRIAIDGCIDGNVSTIYINPKLRKIVFRINTGSYLINVSVYNKAYLKKELELGREITVIGKYEKYKNNIVCSEIRFEKLNDTPTVEPVYYTTNGLNRKFIAKIINTILDSYHCNDYIPDYLVDRYNFMPKLDALKLIHNPYDGLVLKKSKQRLKYEELFMYLFKINYLKLINNNGSNKVSKDIDIDKVNDFISRLPFSLTSDQLSSVKEIVDDLKSNRRMNRLLQGDVGSGKTIVAFIAVYANYLAGYQSALMVPTEILANQHYQEASRLFDGIMKVSLLTSSTSSKDKKIIYNKLSNREIDFIIGTQSLIQDKVMFNNLGLVITDEQHRFGVNQRDTFRNKGELPDILSMSATPIPRTYALTIYGDMDVSSIKTKPVGRKDVITYLKGTDEIMDVLIMMKKELDEHHQIYVIAPMINEEGEASVNSSVVDLEDKMNRAFGKMFKIASVHGKMDPKEKNSIMSKFEEGEVDILISTTVIEVGVNVKNATMMVIFNANLFGLSTLHQLRGRVGRNSLQSYCVLIADNKEERLAMLENCSDGFKISEYDFKNRGEGDLFGLRQSGETGLILANVKRDYELLLRVKKDVDEFMPIFMNNRSEYQLLDDVGKKLEGVN